jgi:CheY-like chemotaxis protein
MLTTIGYSNVAVADNGKIALEKLQTVRPDVLLMDIMVLLFPATLTSFEDARNGWIGVHKDYQRHIGT